jgi:SAM-dependent methyltransferase
VERKLEVPTLKDELRALIVRYLELRYVSESCKDGIRTENRYQSVNLGELQSAGIRSARDEVLDQIDFSGKRVLDLGSNLGELSRGARARGAELVDAFEHDEFFIELAAAIDSFAQVTRVSHHRRDITDPSIYVDSYDVVLAFSVFVYIEPVLEQIASITDGVLVLETHRLEDNLEDYYVRVVGRHLPHYAILGESDWDARLGDEQDRRAIVAFARDEPTLLEALSDSGAEAGPPQVLRSALARRLDWSDPPREVEIDLGMPPKEALQSRFFMMFRFDSMAELLDAVDGIEIDLDALAKSIEVRNLLAEGWVYWFLFTKGYLQYARTGEIGQGNVYFDYLVRYFLEQGHDPGAHPELSDHPLAVERVARRFRDFDLLRAQGAVSPEPDPGTNPVRITVSDLPRDPPLQLYEVGADAPIPVRNIDGWHRLCSARLSGLSSYPCEAVPENLHSKPIRGELERFSFDGRRLQVGGWWLRPGLPAFNLEVRAGRQIVATGPVTDRPDVEASFPHVSHAVLSGFDVDVECELDADEPVRFDLIALQEIVPVGVIPLLHVPGAPVGEATTVYQLLQPVVRGRSLESLGSIVAVGADGPPLGEALEHLLPAATVTTADAGRLAELPPDSADLVIADGLLPGLVPEEQLQLLERVRAVVKEDGLVAVTVLGELVRPFVTAAETLAALDSDGIAEQGPGGTVQTRKYTERGFSEGFEIVAYVEGGVRNLCDLALLRKR